MHNNVQLIGHKKGKGLTVLKFKRDIGTGDNEDIRIKVSLKRIQN